MSRIGTKNIEFYGFYKDQCFIGEDINCNISEDCKDNIMIFRPETSLDFDDVVYGDLSNKYIMHVVKSSCTTETFVDKDVFDILKKLSAIRALNESLNGFDFYFFDMKHSIDYDEYVEEMKYKCPECGVDLRECGLYRKVVQYFTFSHGNDSFEYDKYSDDEDEDYYCNNCNAQIDTDNFEIRE